MTLVTRRDNGNRIARDPFAFARDLFAWDFGDEARAQSTYAPRFEVRERPDVFEIRADVPGVKEADLDISLHQSVLTISGSRAGEAKQEGETLYVYERQFGTFTRAFSLPDIADGDRIDARLHEGVLTVTIAKKAEAKPKKIAFKKG